MSCLLQTVAEIWMLLGPIIAIQKLLKRFSMKIIGLKSAHISATNCNKELYFGEWTLFKKFFPSILSYPIISQIHVFVVSHFTTLLLFKYSIQTNKVTRRDGIKVAAAA